MVDYYTDVLESDGCVEVWFMQHKNWWKDLCILNSLRCCMLPKNLETLLPYSGKYLQGLYFAFCAI